MKNYELIIERKQPSCGGKDPKEVTVLNVATEDPVAYVKAAEKTEAVTVTENPNGELVVEVCLGQRQIRYSFTED